MSNLQPAVTEYSQHHTWHNIFRFPKAEDEKTNWSSPFIPFLLLPLPSPSASCIFSLPFSSLPCRASILTESVSLWLSHPVLPLKLPLAPHLFLFSCSSIYSYMFCFLLQALSSGVSLLVIIFSPCLSASFYCNHLFTQPVAHFCPSPASYSLILSDFITLTQETTAANSDSVILFVSELWCIHRRVNVCTCEAALHKLKG